MPRLKERKSVNEGCSPGAVAPISMTSSRIALPAAQINAARE